MNCVPYYVIRYADCNGSGFESIGAIEKIWGSKMFWLKFWQKWSKPSDVFNKSTRRNTVKGLVLFVIGGGYIRPRNCFGEVLAQLEQKCRFKVFKWFVNFESFGKFFQVFSYRLITWGNFVLEIGKLVHIGSELNAEQVKSSLK